MLKSAPGDILSLDCVPAEGKRFVSQGLVDNLSKLLEFFGFTMSQFGDRFGRLAQLGLVENI